MILPPCTSVRNLVPCPPCCTQSRTLTIGGTSWPSSHCSSSCSPPSASAISPASSEDPCCLSPSRSLPFRSSPLLRPHPRPPNLTGPVTSSASRARSSS